MVRDMEPADIVGDPTTHLCTYHDGSSRTVLTTGIEVPFPDGELLLSRTDRHGVITEVNDAFVRLTGYSPAELVGHPHHVLRHPDMPSIAFADMWQVLEAGGRWRGYLQNLRRDGAHFWSYTTIIPRTKRGRIVGYTAVHTAPARSRVEEAMRTYAVLV